MVAEYWQLGEDVQDAIRRGGYEAETVEGIAVDIHDLLQATEKIQRELAPALLKEGHDLPARIRELAAELEHVRWHCDAAIEHLQAAERQIAQSGETA